MRLRSEQVYLVGGAVLLIMSVVLQVARDNANLLNWYDFSKVLALVAVPQGLVIGLLAFLVPRRLGIAAGLTATIWIVANLNELAPVLATFGIDGADFEFAVIVVMPVVTISLCLLPNVLVSRLVGTIGVAFFAMASVQLAVAMVDQKAIFGTIDTARLVDPDPIAHEPEARPAGASLPDIFYIVPDRYPNSGVLARAYNYDNTPFLDALRSRGFAVASDARANYLRTYVSLASSMNMQYLDPVLAELDGRTLHREPIYRLIRNNLVTERLRRMGYRILWVPNWWDGTRNSEQADEVVQLWRLSFAGEFGRAVLDRSPFVLIVLYHAVGRSKCENFRRQLDFLADAGGDDRPTFVFMHILVPHMPILMDAKGNCISEVSYPTTPAGITWDQFKNAFAGFLTYFNNRILEIIDRQNRENPNPVIFVLQSDEGPYPRRFHESFARALTKKGADRLADFDWRKATDDELAMKFGTLNALYFSGGQHQGVPDTLTPVNNWRVIFSEIDGIDYPRLPDRYFIYPDARSPYTAVDITERLEAIPR